MYLSFYNLKVKPFQMSTDPDFLWLGEQHKEALATLKYAIIENKGVLCLTGDVGTGKTTLINALIQSLGDDTLAATIYDPSLGVLEFFNVVASAFNMGKTFESKGQFIIILLLHNSEGICTSVILYYQQSSLAVLENQFCAKRIY